MVTQPLDDRLNQPAGSAGSAVTTAWKPPEESVESEAAEATLERITRLVARIHEEKREAPSEPPAAAVAEESVPVSAEAVSMVVFSGAEPAPSESTTSPAGPVHAKSQHDDDALQTYMDQFLERVTGKKKPEPAAVAGVPGLASPFAPTAPAAEPPSYKPRELKRPPESAQELSAMRELANHSARQALGVHAERGLTSEARRVFLGALACSLTSSLFAVCFLAWRIPGTWTLALLVMPLALVLTWRYWSLQRKLALLDD